MVKRRKRHFKSRAKARPSMLRWSKRDWKRKRVVTRRNEKLYNGNMHQKRNNELLREKIEHCRSD